MKNKHPPLISFCSFFLYWRLFVICCCGGFVVVVVVVFFVLFCFLGGLGGFCLFVFFFVFFFFVFFLYWGPVFLQISFEQIALYLLRVTSAPHTV